MKLANLRADAVVGKRLFDLVGDVAIDVTEAVKEKRQQDDEDHDGGDDQARENRVTPRKVAPASYDRGLLRRRFREILPGIRVVRIVCTHNTQPPRDSGNFECLEGETEQVSALYCTAVHGFKSWTTKFGWP